MVVATACAAALSVQPVAQAAGGPGGAPGGSELVGRAVLPAATFAPGPVSGTLLGKDPINGQSVPFPSQPVQGFSAMLPLRDGSYLAMPDNGYGSLENSADFLLRVYRITPRFETAKGGAGDVQVGSFISLHDPDRRIPFAITNHFTKDRLLTGADFDIESIQRAADGTLWFGDEFGPYLLHTDDKGRVLEAPVPLPDPAGGVISSPQNPGFEEASAVRVMNAMRTSAALGGSKLTPVFSPDHSLLADNDPATGVASRTNPPAGSGLASASSELFNVGALHTAGFDVVPYTINDPARMTALLKLGVDGIISDEPDTLYAAVAAYDANGDGTAGDYLTADGRIDITKIDAQGHRGARNLRPENTLPAMEAALDNRVTTLETDTGISADGVPVLDHDPRLESAKCRRVDGKPYGVADEVLVKDLTAAEIQKTFICDNLLTGRPRQTNDPALSPVTTAYTAARGIPHIYTKPTLEQLFDFVCFYADYYTSGAGRTAPNAAVLAANARNVRFNIETKINPRPEFAARTVGPEAFEAAVAGVIIARGMTTRSDIQSFDWRTLRLVHKKHPAIRTVALVGDFPAVTVDGQVVGDGTNLQNIGAQTTPWLAGLPWPYRATGAPQAKARRSGGFEGMAVSPDGHTLYPLLEQPLVGSDSSTLLISEFDTRRAAYTGKTWTYRLSERGTNIGDFQLFDGQHGVIIERDGSQGDLNGFKAIYQITLGKPGGEVTKKLAADLLNIRDQRRISEPSLPGDVGIGERFAMPFNTIEDVLVLDRQTLLVADDNNFPFSVGRHVGSGRPDDNEIIMIRLDEPLG